MSATAVSASKSSGICGTQIDAKPACLGGLGVGDELRDLVAVPAPLGADHQADPHRVPFRRSGVGATLTSGRARAAMAFSFSRAALRSFRESSILSPAQAVRGGST